MTSTAGWRGSIVFVVFVSGGLSCGGGSVDSPASSSAGTGASSGGSAGSMPAGTSGAGGHSTSSAGTGSGTAGSQFNSAAGMSNGTSGAGGTSNGGTSNGGTSSGGTSSSAGMGGASTVNCPASDPLKTNNTKADAYDCMVLEVSAKWGMPDPMIVKCQIQQESSFQIFAISGDSPCKTPQGWLPEETKSFGLIQTTPACGEAKTALLPNGHPNLDQDMTSALWATSVFNPSINLDAGVQTDTSSLKALKQKYAGCTVAQYNMMAAGAFNSGDGAVLGCGMYDMRAQAYVDAITSHYHQFAPAAAWPDPY